MLVSLGDIDYRILLYNNYCTNATKLYQNAETDVLLGSLKCAYFKSIDTLTIL